MIELKPIDWNDFFNTLHLFAPKEFTARLLERSFRQPEGWWNWVWCWQLWQHRFLLRNKRKSRSASKTSNSAQLDTA